jgi:hypothetical protein
MKGILIRDKSNGRCCMNSTTHFFKVILVVGFGLFLISCGVAMTKGQIWLDSKRDNPEVNVSGTWSSPEWGLARFKQENRNVEGVLGDYPAKGVVSGYTLYLLMYSGDKAHYSAELKALDNNTFKGSYSKYSLVDETKSKKPINLKRMN